MRRSPANAGVDATYEHSASYLRYAHRLRCQWARLFAVEQSVGCLPLQDRHRIAPPQQHHHSYAQLGPIPPGISCPFERKAPPQQKLR